MTFDFITSKLEGESGTWLWTSLIVSVVISHELTIASTYISNVCSASSFKLLLYIFRSAFRMLLAVLICHSHTPPMWLAKGGFLIHVIQLALCLCRYFYIWLWPISWKAFWSSLIAPTKLVPLSDLIKPMFPCLPLNLLNESIKESVYNDCATSMWIARLYKQVNITPYLFNSFL